MFQEVPREKKWISWLFVAVWASIIFCAVPFSRAILAPLNEWGGPNFLRYLAIAGIIGAALVAVFYLGRHPEIRSWKNIAWLVGVVVIYVYLSLEKLSSPQEAFHFLEYGFLGMLAFRAVSRHLRDAGAYFAAIIVCALLGTIDEIIQWLTPERYWDLRDWGWDILAGTLAQVAIAQGMRPQYLQKGFSRRSVQWICALLVAQLLLLGFCMSNTPKTLDRVIKRVPRLTFLSRIEVPMSEYGYRHDDPEIGIFYSRFTIEELKQTDAERAEETATILDRYRDPSLYSEFLRKYTPANDPFTHEACVHLYRRDHYKNVAWKYKADPKMHAYHLNVAYRENQILEKYFHQTLRQSSYVWSSNEVAFLTPYMSTQRVYRSPVSEHLITSIRERDVWVVIGVAVFSILWMSYAAKTK